jgi:hypothetical protein
MRLTPNPADLPEFDPVSTSYEPTHFATQRFLSGLHDLSSDDLIATFLQISDHMAMRVSERLGVDLLDVSAAGALEDKVFRITDDVLHGSTRLDRVGLPDVAP